MYPLMIRAVSILMICGMMLASSQTAVGQAEGQVEPALDDSRVSRFALPNGVRVLSIFVEDATRQCTFTFLPLSLANDPVHQSQWSHLAEHMLIRSTDPENLSVVGMEFNGETGPDYLRLDSYADANHWQESLDRHARWLIARTFDVEGLEAEKAKVAGEESFVQSNGYTHKFALAAWNQIVTHGLDRAAVHGDVENATVEALQTYVESRIPINQQVLVATVGPTDPTTLKKVLTETLGQLPETPIQNLTPNGNSKRQLEGIVEATWDLQQCHVLVWWELPNDDSPSGIATSQLLSSVMMMNLRNPVTAVDPTAKILVHANVHTIAGSSAIVVNVSFADATKYDEMNAAITTAVMQSNGFAQQIRQYGVMFAQQFQMPMDLGPLRQQMERANPGIAQMLEANILLGLAQLEFKANKPFGKVVKAMQSLRTEDVQQAVDRIAQEPTGILFLRPEAVNQP